MISILLVLTAILEISGRFPNILILQILAVGDYTTRRTNETYLLENSYAHSGLIVFTRQRCQFVRYSRLCCSLVEKHDQPGP